MLKLWEVSNGWTGNSYVRCLVVAETEEQAKELGRAQYKAEVDEERVKFDSSYSPEKLKLPGVQQMRLRLKGEDYYADLQVELLCEDLTQPWCGEVNDG